MMKISYLTDFDARDVHKWSGLGYYIARSLEDQHAKVEYVGDLSFKPGPVDLLKMAAYRLLDQKYIAGRSVHAAKQYASQAMQRLSADTDVLFSPSTLPLAFLKSDKPRVFYTDASFGGMLGFYQGMQNVSRETIRQGNLVEQKALDECALAIYASDWAAQDAIRCYRVDEKKVHVVPFGANISPGPSFTEVETFVQQRSHAPVRLLFIGVEWERKGGDRALEITRKLNEMGIRTELHVLGLKTFPVDPLPPYVISHGFISKSTSQGREEIAGIMKNSHFLLMPARAEAYGLVYCEANAYGVPAIATRVGGIPTIVKDGVNGKLFSLEDPDQSYADYIRSALADRNSYDQLCYQTYQEYKSRLNWKVAGEKLLRLLHSL